MLAVVGISASAPGCRRSSSRTGSPALGDYRTLEPAHVGADYRAAWERLQEARERDPAAPDVARAARDLLGQRPPPSLALHAHLALAEHAYLNQQDAAALTLVDRALASNPGPEDLAVATALAVVRVRALVRSGDPERALAALVDPKLRGARGLTREERQGLYAVALDRNGRVAEALAAFAGWRALLADHDPAAAYAEDRIQRLGPTVDRERLRAAAKELSPSPTRQCLEAIAGLRPPRTAASWVQSCGRGDRRVGLLLPRTGALAALADTQLAAASVAVRVLLEEDAQLEILHQDSGSDPASALEGARALVRSGVDTIVGPVGPANVEAVAKQIGEGIEVIVPGEAGDPATGVGPSIEQRVSALIDTARRSGAGRFVVLAPDNGYGRRAVKAVNSRLHDATSKSLSIAFYEPNLTSFASILTAHQGALKGRAALLIPDHVARVELIVRQMMRSGLDLDRGGGTGGTLVLTTGEGIDPARLAGPDAILEGVLVAPAASPSELAEPFMQAYHAAQGAWPSDQALLLYYALRRALFGPLPPGTTSGVAKISEGRLVPLERS